MTLRTFTDIHRARTMLLEMPPRLMSMLEDAEARDTLWELHFSRTGAHGPVWTLLLRMDGEFQATQWTELGSWTGEWIPSRRAVLFDEDDRVGLFNVEGNRVPEDEDDQAEEEEGEPA